MGRLGGFYNVKYYRNCDHLIANTSEIADYLVNSGWDRERVHYLPNFVGGRRAQPVKRADFYTPDTAPLILALGRLHENKAFDVLLKAVARVPNIYVWIAGEGPLRKQLEHEAEVLGIKPRVRILFPVDDFVSLANFIKRLIGDEELHKTIVENGYDQYEAEFTEPIVVDKYVKFFEQLLN